MPGMAWALSQEALGLGGGVGQRKAQDQSGSVLWGALQEVYTIGLRAWGLGAGGQRGRRGGGNS